MIWRRLLPPDGGGSLRRWIEVNKSIYRNRLDKEQLTNRPVPLFDFSRLHDAVDARKTDASGEKGGWRISDDETIGGLSRGTLKLVQSMEEQMKLSEKRNDVPSGFRAPQTLNSEKEAENVINLKECNNSTEEQISIDGERKQHHFLTGREHGAFVPFVRWQGSINTTLPESSDNRVKRSGFCAIRSPEFLFNGATLADDYNALEIVCRSDGRTYTVNLKVQTYFPDDLYQGFITIPATTHETTDSQHHPWTTLVLPFDEFVLTAFGRMREIQRTLDGGVDIEHIGVTLADGIDGDFLFDLARIRAINFNNGKIVGEDS